MVHEYSIKNAFIAKLKKKSFCKIQFLWVRLTTKGLASRVANTETTGWNFVRSGGGRVRRYASSAGTQFECKPTQNQWIFKQSMFCVLNIHYSKKCCKIFYKNFVKTLNGNFSWKFISRFSLFASEYQPHIIRNIWKPIWYIYIYIQQDYKIAKGWGFAMVA